MIYTLGYVFKNNKKGWRNFVVSLGIPYFISNAERCRIINDALLKYKATYLPVRLSEHIHSQLPSEVDFSDDNRHTMFILKYGVLE